jgi:hypothetical protein
MKHDLKVILIFVLVFFLIGAAGVRGETLQDAVKSVLQNNPDITSVAYNRLARDQEVRQAMGDFSRRLIHLYQPDMLTRIIRIANISNRRKRMSGSLRIYSGEVLHCRKRIAKNHE